MFQEKNLGIQNLAENKDGARLKAMYVLTKKMARQDEKSLKKTSKVFLDNSQINDSRSIQDIQKQYNIQSLQK